MSMLHHARPQYPAEDNTDQWSVSWRTGNDEYVEQTFNLTRVNLDTDVFDGIVDGQTVVLIPRERFISAVRADTIPAEL